MTYLPSGRPKVSILATGPPGQTECLITAGPIARHKRCDVLFVVFGPRGRGDIVSDYDYEADVRRREIIAWLGSHQIPWLPCGAYASTSGFSAYDGRIYLDAPYDESEETYRLVRGYLENPNGSGRYADVLFCYLPLEKAMENVHRDEPGFWERLGPKISERSRSYGNGLTLL